MNSVRLNIEGLEENETQGRVKDQLEGIIGVKGVFVSTGQDYVDIKYNDETTIAEINSHLKNNGYKVMDFTE